MKQALLATLTALALSTPTSGPAQADSISLQYWDVPQVHLEVNSYFLEVGGDRDTEIYTVGKRWTWEYMYAETGLGWHEYDWGHDKDDDLFLLAGVGVQHHWKSLAIAAGYRYTNVNSDADRTGERVDLNGPVLRVGWRW